MAELKALCAPIDRQVVWSFKSKAWNNGTLFGFEGGHHTLLIFKGSLLDMWSVRFTCWTACHQVWYEIVQGWIYDNSDSNPWGIEDGICMNCYAKWSYEAIQASCTFIWLSLSHWFRTHTTGLAHVTLW